MTFYSVEILIEFDDVYLASTLSKALEPDNKTVPPHVKLKMRTINNLLKVDVTVMNRLGSLQATLDDLIICLQAAYQSLRILK